MEYTSKTSFADLLKAVSIYSVILLFTLLLHACKTDNPVNTYQPPATEHIALTTTAINSITATTAISGGNISSDGGEVITARGVCWSSSPNPTTALSTKTLDSTGVGSFSSSLKGLMTGTTYFVRAYAINSIDTGYGNELSFTTPFAIGRSYGGGIIFYIDTTGVHGLIAATSDQSSHIEWYNGSNITTGATATAVGTGLSNTNAIVTAQGAGSYAASICKNYRGGGYDDWFLPSKNELNLLYLQQSYVGSFALNYWSSTEGGNDAAWDQDFSNGYQYNSIKGSTIPVRAIRAF